VICGGVQGGGYVLSWDFTLLSEDGVSSSSSSSSSSVQQEGGDRGVDVGFSVIGRTAGGYLPLLTPYRRVGPEGRTHVGSLRLRLVGEEEEDEQQWSEGLSVLVSDKDEELRLPFGDVIVLFDNSYSWFRPKFVK
jgi:hypothetical protein